MIGSINVTVLGDVASIPVFVSIECGRGVFRYELQHALLKVVQRGTRCREWSLAWAIQVAVCIGVVATVAVCIITVRTHKS